MHPNIEELRNIIIKIIYMKKIKEIIIIDTHITKIMMNIIAKIVKTMKMMTIQKS